MARISMPAGVGGIVRYFEEYKSKLVIKPGYVILFALLVILGAFFLHLFGKTILGF